MKSFVLRTLAALIVFGGFSHTASASTIKVGFLSFDDLGGVYTFDITSLTGANSFAPDYPVSTPLTFTVTGLTAAKNGGGTLTLPGSAFTTDASTGNVNCLAAGDAFTGGCDFASYDLLSATLTGTLSPTSGLTGLPAGFSGILSSFSVTLFPSAGNNLLSPGDFVDIEATLVADTSQVPVPEPSTLMLMQLGIGALGSYKLRHHAPLLRRLTGRRDRDQ